jgi:hypothetical protein
MKKIIFLIIVIAGLGFVFSCQKETKDPVLDISQTQKPNLTSPADGETFVLTQANADDIMATFTWSPASYNLSNLESVKYILQMDYADSGFVNPVNLTTTTETTYTITVSGMNQILLGMELSTGDSHDLEFRVRSYINETTDYTDVLSEVIKLSITPYADIVYIKPIYLLGDATPVGWDNTAALEMAHIGEGKFARVETLDPASGDWFKFISVLGQWAPQWGTDDTGTGEQGPLVYRPDEGVPDPPAMPVPGVAGSYYIEADTALLEYRTILTSGELYLIGDATSVGWDNTAGIQFTEEQPHIFTVTTTLNAEGGMKFLEVPGQWAPQWGTDANGNAEEGNLFYRPTESVPDPANIPAPGNAGQYKITVDLTSMTYSVEPQ